jgi:DnaJ domain
MSNPYEIIGVWRDASAEEIEQRYRLLCDRFADERQDDPVGVASRLATVQEAHAILSDPARRSAYDETLKNPTPAEPELDLGSPASQSPLDVLSTKTRKHVDPQLRDGEEVIAVIKGDFDQAIIALEARLVIVKPGWMAGTTFGAKVTSFDYRSITAIEVNKKMMTAVIEVIAAGYQGVQDTSWWTTNGAQSASATSNCLPLGRTAADTAEPAIAHIRKRIARAHGASTSQPSASGIADELTKLAELHKQGILSAVEFESAKERVLSSA